MDLKRHDLIAIIFFSVILTLVGAQRVFSFTGTMDVISPGALEITSINATYYYKNDVSINERLDGDWGAIDLETTGTLSTGQGKNELYGMDQNVTTTSDVTFNGVTTSWIELDGKNSTSWTPMGYDYYINWNSTHHRVWDGRPGELTVREDLTSVNLDTSTENCLSDDAGRIVIKWGPDCDGDGRTLTSSRSRYTIFTGLAHEHQGDYKTPRISKILFENVGVDPIRDILIQGINFQEMDFHANEYSIQGITVKECYMNPNSTYDGIIFRDTDTNGGEPFIDWIKFIDLQIDDDRSQAVDDEGCIRFADSNDGTGQFWFERTKYHATVDDTVFMCFDEGRVSPTVWIDDPSFDIHGNRTVLFHTKSNAYITSVSMDSAWIEIKENFVLLEIDSGTKRASFTIDTSYWEIGSNCNVTVIDNGNANYYDWHSAGYNGLFGSDNKLSASSLWKGTFTPGTLNLNRRFNWEWSYHFRSYNTTESEQVRKDHGYLTTSPHIDIDHFYDGITSVGNKAGEALYFGDIVYLTSNGDWNETDADFSATMPVMGVVLDDDSGDEKYMRLLLQGHIRDISKFDFAVKGGLVYGSTAKGRLTQTQPNGSGDQVQIVGYFVGDYTIYFDPCFNVTAIP